MSVRTWCAVAAIPVAGAVLLASAGPAWAKSDVDLSVSAHTVHVGHSVRVSASGGDDDFDATRVCAQIEQGKRWADLRCSEENVVVPLRETHVTTARLRAVVFAPDKSGHFRVVDRVSGTQAVRFVR